MTSPLSTRKGAYRFLPGETLAEGFSRILAGQIRKARKHLATHSDAVRSVHETRKALKRIRALLALCRPALGDKAYRTENARFRDIARLLATSRDQAVLRSSIAILRQRLINDESSETAVASPLDGVKLDPRLARHADAGLAALFEDMELQEEEMRNSARQPGGASKSGPLGEAIAALAEAADRQPEPASQMSASEEVRIITMAYSAGYRNCYALGRREMRAAFASADDECFHEWRKAVQLHWRQSVLLSTPWPALMRARAEAARELSQIIGQDHDLAVLAVYAAGKPIQVLTDKRRAAVLKTIERCQTSLRGEAKKIGSVLYAQKPAEIQSMIDCTWTASCDKDGRLLPPHPALIGPLSAAELA